MKSTEIIEPAAFSQPVAAQGSRNEIPQEATGTNLASVAEGFPDITMISPTDGGLPPFGQDFNGLFYLTTTQWVYLQNGGFITFNQNVSDTIGGYPKGAILGYINSDNILYNVRSLIDDNTYNFNENSDYINDEYWELLATQTSGFANKELSNLTAAGLSQYNVFCINTGSVDDSGNPSFLTLSESTQTTTDEETEEETTTTTYTLTTSGSFDVTTANGSIYTISDTLEYTAADLEDGTYNIFIDPVNNTISLSQNEITIGSAFPSSAVSGDYLLNTSKIPYDFQQITITTDTDEETEEETTTSSVTKGLNEVYAGVLTVSGGGNLSLNTYNSDFMKAQEIGEPRISLTGKLNENEIWLEGSEVSKSAYPLLYLVYGDTYGTPEDEDNFVLPDFRGRVLQGADGFGYIEAGLPNITGYFTSSTNIGAPFDGSSGAFSISGEAAYAYANGGTKTTYTKVSFNASSISSIYGSSDTVQPPAICVRVKTRYK